MSEPTPLAQRLVCAAVEASGFVPGGSHAVERIPRALVGFLRELDAEVGRRILAGEDFIDLLALADSIEKGGTP